METGITLSTVAEQFGWNLRSARRKAALTQRELAGRMGRSQRRIAEWESGKLCPRINSIVRLAEALRIEPGELLRETKGLGG